MRDPMFEVRNRARCSLTEKGALALQDAAKRKSRP
jgi:hypothetical protein